MRFRGLGNVITRPKYLTYLKKADVADILKLRFSLIFVNICAKNNVIKIFCCCLFVRQQDCSISSDELILTKFSHRDFLSFSVSLFTGLLLICGLEDDALPCRRVRWLTDRRTDRRTDAIMSQQTDSRTKPVGSNGQETTISAWQWHDPTANTNTYEVSNQRQTGWRWQHQHQLQQHQ